MYFDSGTEKILRQESSGKTVMPHYPGVSIVVISHNEEKNIRDCLKSLLSQNYPDERYEIIVVDSSTDGTKEKVSEYEPVILVPSTHKEFSKKRNTGIREAKYELIAFIDADCIVPPDYLGRLTRVLIDGGVAAVACSVFPPPDAPRMGRYIACLGKPAGGAIGFDSYFTRLGRGINVVGSGHTLFKKSVLLEVGGFSEDRRFDAGGEDKDVSQRIIDAGYVLEYEADAFIYHKTRSFRDFLKWSYRHGFAQYLYYRSQDSFIRVLFSPFSLTWVFLLMLLLMSVPLEVFLVILVVLVIVAFIIFYTRRNIFPTGRRKLKLLIRRRKRIGVSLFSIFLVVIPLSYVDKLVMNLGHLHCFFFHKREEVRDIG